MKRSSYLLSVTCIAVVFTAAVSPMVLAAEPSVLAQDLVKVRDSGKVIAALWTRRGNSYTLQLVIPRQPVPVNAGTRGSFFTGPTIANLRGLDPGFGSRTLTVVDGRRAVPDDQAAPVSAQPAEQKVAALPPNGPPRIQVWLLRADGTQIQPTWRSADPVPNKACSLRCIADEIMYRFPIAESAQAVAAAIQVDSEYYIEKLQPLEPKPAAH